MNIWNHGGEITLWMESKEGREENECVGWGRRIMNVGECERK